MYKTFLFMSGLCLAAVAGFACECENGECQEENQMAFFNDVKEERTVELADAAKEETELFVSAEEEKDLFAADKKEVKDFFAAEEKEDAELLVSAQEDDEVESNMIA